MNRRDPQLLLRPSPFLESSTHTPGIMRDVLLALLPVLAVAMYHFGWLALLVTGSAVAGSVLAEWAFTGQRPRHRALRDGSAVLTGLLLGLILPPGVPLWMAFLGGVVSIGLGKAVWGGLGHNLFNPALVGRAFLQAAFPTAITTWTAQGASFAQVSERSLATPLLQPAPPVDAISAATPLGLAKFQQEFTALIPLVTGDVAGSLGETSAGIVILCGLWLAWRRAFDWRIPVSILLAVAIFSGVAWAVDPQAYPSPLFMIGSGGLLFGAVYMATDPVTSPMAPRAVWIFGGGIGALVVLIRLWGGLPEGVMYAILLMNAATPLINRAVRPRPFGRVAAPPETGGAS